MTTGPDVRFAAVGDVELAYTTMGNPQAPPVLLIAGLSGQLISWDDQFCRLVVDRGLFVNRLDNRDVGLSTHFDDAAGAGVPGAQAPVSALADLAPDAAGVDRLPRPRLGSCGGRASRWAA